MFASLTAVWSILTGLKNVYKILAMVAFAVALYFGVSSAWNNIKESIAAPYVAAERTKVEAEQRAIWAPKFDELTTKFNAQEKQFKDLKQNVIDTRKAQALEAQKAVNKEKERANKNEAKYKEALKKYDAAVAERDKSDITAKQLDDRLRVITAELTTSNGDSTEIGRIRRYADDLGKRYGSCEQALAEANQDADEANDRASRCSAGLRALTSP